MRVESSERWVRGMLGATAVIDTRAPLLFWEDDFPVPSYAYPLADVRTDLLIESPAPPQASGFSFFGPHGPVSTWFDLRYEHKIIHHAAWTREDPALAGRIVFSWEPGVLERWLEEDEVVAGHPRDPHKRVDALHSSRHVTVALDGQVLADSRDTVALFETFLPTRYYFPRTDVALNRLTAVERFSHCPYKGDAREYWDAPGANGVAWCYTEPFAAVGAIAGRIAFYNELVDLTVDDQDLSRPETVFSVQAHRPG